MPAPADSPRVHLLCGLNGAGKTTYARRLEEDLGAVRFTLDEWMLRLYPYRYDEPEYARSAVLCRDLIWTVAQRVLALGRPVVLDWNLWNRNRRAEWRDRAQRAGLDAILHYLDVPVDLAVSRSDARNIKAPAGAHRLTAAGIRHLASIFEPPTTDEGMRIIHVTA